MQILVHMYTLADFDKALLFLATVSTFVEQYQRHILLVGLQILVEQFVLVLPQFGSVLFSLV